MKNLLVILLLGLSATGLLAGPSHEADSLLRVLKTATTDTGRSGRIYVLTRLANEYLNASLDTALMYSTQAYKQAKKIRYADGLSRSANLIGTVYLRAGNFAKAQEYYLEKLKIEEQRNEPEMLAIALMNIAGAHQKAGNYDKAAAYTLQCDSIIDAHRIGHLKLYTLLNLGDIYEKWGKLPDAQRYTEKTYALALKQNDLNFEGAALNNLGNIYMKSGDPEQAIRHYAAALPFLEASGDQDFLAESTIGLAKAYRMLGRPDSALWYGKRSYAISKANGYLNKQLNAGLLLTGMFKDRNDIRQAFQFQEEALALNDSIFSKEKIAHSQFLSMEEDLRQRDIAEKKAEAEHERIMKLQFLSIGLALPILFFITLYLSNRKVKPKYIEFLGVVSLLLTFEYIMLLIHPLVGKITHHLPFYQLLIFAAIASILTPAHHRIEHWLLKLLTRKEKMSVLKIRIQ